MLPENIEWAEKMEARWKGLSDNQVPQGMVLGEVQGERQRGEDAVELLIASEPFSESVLLMVNTLGTGDEVLLVASYLSRETQRRRQQVERAWSSLARGVELELTLLSEHRRINEASSKGCS